MTNIESVQSVGNQPDGLGEFNFRVDPEVAKIVFDHFPTKYETALITWEACCMNPFPSFIISEETKLKSKLGEFLFTIKRDYGNNKLQFDRSQVHYEFKVILVLP